jgi:hypothetical protein
MELTVGGGGAVSVSVGKNYSTKTFTSCELVSSFLIVDFCKILLHEMCTRLSKVQGKKETRNKK